MLLTTTTTTTTITRRVCGTSNHKYPILIITTTDIKVVLLNFLPIE